MDGQDKRPILIVDDQLDSVKPIMMMLHREGYEPLYADTGDAAMEILEAVTPDLILIDVILPGESGFDVFRRVRARPATATTPILFVSGMGEVENKISGLNLGASDFVVKPYDVREVIARIALQLRLKDQDQLLRAKNDELLQAYHDLKAAQAQVVQSEKLATIGRISAGIAHEMSTPLSFIISNLKTMVQYLREIEELLLSHQELLDGLQGQALLDLVEEKRRAVEDVQKRINLPNLNREIKDICRDCLEGSEVIARIANDLREFSRDDQEDMTLSDVNSLLDKALNLARNELGDRILVERKYEELPLLLCIPNRMTQLFLILFVNAAQAIPGNGTVTVKTLSEHGNVNVLISDTGIGIREEHLPRLFEPFFTTKPAEKGTGLGLSIAQKIVNFHGGVISARSRAGEGTVMEMVFPIK